MRMMIRNILKKAITDTVAQNFSWAGNKTKRSFQNLGLAQIIIRKCIFDVVGLITIKDLSKHAYLQYNVLNIFLCHTETVQKTFGDVTDNDIETYISKWLDQATSRVEKTKYLYSSIYNQILI